MPWGGRAWGARPRAVVAVRRLAGYGRAVRPNRLGSAAWLVQPLYVAVELVVAAAAAGTVAASAAYSLRDDTISALGQLTCAPGHSGSTVLVCSPGHAVLNVAFVVFASLRVLGALLLHPSFAPGWVRAAATGLWALSGLCSAAVGLVPVDQRPALHALVAAPVFVLQPLAVLATAAALRRTAGAVPGWVVTTGVAVGGLTAAAAAAFGLRLGQQTWVGGLERLALWPAYLWLGALGAVLLVRRARVSGRG
ncbi:uncharacterized protein DUF998 [Humibacillus xanthopallidus]|uniref:Uncharacterized protein DUF998 n=1 Tax=Humibacillus xanthopallidus TaxID=412689 RepID=A0A543HVT2_9MICO|nr:uncharacterized protein DUF998 [Humibacillus xanthopallidus]